MNWQNLRGILGNIFRLGLTGVNLKSNSGKLQVRNTADTAAAPIEASAVELESNGSTLSLEAPSGLASAFSLFFPGSTGSPNQVLTTDGSGNLFWASAGGAASADKDTIDQTSLAFGSASPVAMFTTPSNSEISQVRVKILSPFDGSPSLSIGIAGDTAKYLASTQVDLTQPAGTEFSIVPGTPISASEDLIATYAANGSTAGSALLLVHYSIPA